VCVDDPAQNLPYLAGWCVEVRDASGAVIATTVTSGVSLDIEGNNYVITGVPAGTYTVCEVLPPNSTWHETTPASGPDCGGGTFGLIAVVMDGGAADLLWFGNLPYAVGRRLPREIQGPGLFRRGLCLVTSASMHTARRTHSFTEPVTRRMTRPASARGATPLAEGV